jgi:hypothetical protein
MLLHYFNDGILGCYNVFVCHTYMLYDLYLTTYDKKIYLLKTNIRSYKL